MTTTDNALTRPWSVKKSYERLPTVVWGENNCTEDLNDVFIGKEQYMLGADGNLMPIEGPAAAGFAAFQRQEVIAPADWRKAPRGQQAADGPARGMAKTGHTAAARPIFAGF